LNAKQSLEEKNFPQIGIWEREKKLNYQYYYNNYLYKILITENMVKNFVFYNPTKVIFGKNTISAIGKEIVSAGYKHIMLLAGGGSIKKNGVYEAALKSLWDAGIETITEVWDVQANPALSHAISTIEIAKEENCEAILAIGGGSVIDEAKAVACGVFMDDLWSAYEHKTAHKSSPNIYNSNYFRNLL